MNELFERIRDLLVDKLGVEYREVVPEADLQEDLGADRLDRVEIIMEIEREFSVYIDDDADVFATVQDIVNYLQTRV